MGRPSYTPQGSSSVHFLNYECENLSTTNVVEVEVVAVNPDMSPEFVEK
jgi:hypothetical protein